MFDYNGFFQSSKKNKFVQQSIKIKIIDINFNVSA